MGPIGVDNSEFINLEMEKEFRAKNQHILELAHGKRQDTEGEEEDEGAYDKENDKFLNRLTDGLKHQQHT